jgi:tRNA pseudouridine synthase 10
MYPNQMTVDLLDKKNLEIIEKINSKYKLCDSCLGRVFAKLDNGYNKKKGKILRVTIGFKKVTINKCWLCKGLLNEIPNFNELVHEELKKYEYDTFLIGCKVGEDLIKREQILLDFCESEFFESIKNEINRKIGMFLEESTGKVVDFTKPNIMAIIDTSFDVIELQIASLYIYGRYKKFRRDIPQTKWFCKICRGRGCRNCGYSGKIYQNSVEEIIALTILNETKGEDESFHGAGREDVDVRMLGNGRPFILEVKNPKKRNINLTNIQKMINKEYKNNVQVEQLRFSDKDEIIRIKKADFKKKYRAVIECETPINNEKLKKVTSSLRDLAIKQNTPARVAHRRADMVREKQIYDCKIEKIDDTIATLMFETQSGTYMKELVSGDDGRTNPSIAELIGSPCKVVELDVIEIKGE